MPPRIAVPMPHSLDRDYAERAIPQYERAIERAGGLPVRIPLDQTASEVKKIMERCDGILLPGSKADVDPRKFEQPASPHSAAADSRREDVDFLLLDDAYARRKPVLGICYGLQSLNVYRRGSLIQHIPDFLPDSIRSKVNHAAGKNVGIAHAVKIEPDSILRKMMQPAPAVNEDATVPVNSSHHQSANAIGEGLRVIGRCPDDDIIEALEGTNADHFVLAVQWHPERSIDHDEYSLPIFRALVTAAE